MDYISHNKKYIYRILAESTMLEESEIHTIHIILGTRKGIQNTQSIIHNESYLTTIFIAGNWDQNENGN